MKKFTIYCTEGQTKKALELGALLDIFFDSEVLPETAKEYNLYVYKHKTYDIPTAEQMIGWLEEQEGIYDIHLLRTADGEWKYDVTTKCVSNNPMYGRCRSRKEAMLAAIDAALDYLIDNQQQFTKSDIEWKTGEPSEFGEYLTIRKSRINGSTSVAFNMWATNEVMKNGLFPDSCDKGWQIASPDDCDIIAWAKISDIKI